MFKSIYTTRMSDDGKMLKRRFESIISKNGAKTRLLIAILVALLIPAVTIPTVNILSKTEFVTLYDMDNYAEIVKNNSYMPKLEALGNYENAELRYFRYNWVLGSADTYTLIVKYAPEEYKREKLETNSEHSSLAYFEFDGFNFRVVDTNYHPKRQFYTATSDSTYEIAYIFYYDDDIDYIDVSYQEFLLRECGWEIRGKFNKNDGYEILYDKDGTYNITFTKDNGDILYNQSVDYRHEVTEVGENLYNVCYWSGTNARYDVFVDLKEERVSQEYFNLLCYDEDKVVYCEDDAIVVDHMFGTEKICITRIKRDFSDTFHLSSAIANAELNGDILSLRYLKGENFEEVSEEIDIYKDLKDAINTVQEGENHV
ncbi:MAG: hypothetical protein IJC69_07440 [Clostridia bacterium]|nr:hypothetical protein [Clostridia bacterium]